MTSVPDSQAKAKAQQIVEAIQSSQGSAAALEFIKRVELNPELLALYEKMIFEQFVPNNAAEVSQVDIKSIARAAADYTLARFEGNDLARATKEADAIEKIVYAMPIWSQIPVTEDEVEAMREEVVGGMEHLSGLGSTVAQQAQQLPPQLDEENELRKLAVVRKITEAVQQILSDNICQFIIGTHEAEVGSVQKPTYLKQAMAEGNPDGSYVDSARASRGGNRTLH